MKNYMKNFFKEFTRQMSVLLIVIGLSIIILQPFTGLTGAVIDLSTAISRVWFFIGFGMVIIGMIVLMTTAMKQAPKIPLVISNKYFKNRAEEVLDMKYNKQDMWVSRWELDGLMDYVKNAKDGNDKLKFPKASFEYGRDTPSIHLASGTKGVPMRIPHMHLRMKKKGDNLSRHLFITDDPKDKRLKRAGFDTGLNKFVKSSYKTSHPVSEEKSYKRRMHVS